jgi:hypothetical protein
MFNDKNSINEKSVIGFASFTMMCLFAVADIITGSLGKELVIQEFIFNAFLWMTLGCFGIASVDKYVNKSKETETTDGEQQDI